MTGLISTQTYTTVLASIAKITDRNSTQLSYQSGHSTHNFPFLSPLHSINATKLSKEPYQPRDLHLRRGYRT